MVAVVSPVPAEEVLARLEPTERRWVEEFRDGVRGRWGARIRDMRIYGSKVRGDDHDESDFARYHEPISRGDRGQADRCRGVADG